MTAAKTLHPANQVARAVLDFLNHRGPDGAHLAHVVDHVRASPSSITNALGLLRRLNKVETRPDPGQGHYHRRVRYFDARHAPVDWRRPVPAPMPPRPKKARALPVSAWPQKTAPTATGTTRHRMLRLDPAAPAIVPRSVTVTICPAGHDHRFTIPPGVKIDGAGFVAEWRRLRRGGKVQP